MSSTARLHAALSTLHEFAGLATFDGDHLAAALEELDETEVAAIRVGVARARSALERLDRVQADLERRTRAPLAHFAPPTGMHWRIWATPAAELDRAVPCDCEQNADHYDLTSFPPDAAAMRAAGFNPHSIAGQTAWRRNQKES